MPINYKNYPENWKTKIRPAIMERAKNCCEFCGVKNYAYVFRGIINKNQPTEKEVYQNADGDVFDANNSQFLFNDFWVNIYPLTGKPEQKAVKIVLTIAHLDHDINNNDYSNLKALCQRCHNRYDVAHRKESRKINKGLFSLFEEMNMKGASSRG